MRSRILIALLGLTCLLLVGVVIPLGIAQSRHDRQVFADRAVATLTATAARVEEQADEAAPLPAGLSRYDAQGRLVHAGTAIASGVDAAAVAQALRGQPATRDLDDRLVVIVPIEGRSGVTGALADTVRTEPVDREITRLWLGLAAAALGALALAATLAIGLAGWVARPLRRLTAAAQRLGNGDLTSRAEVESGPSEMRALAHTFDDMAGRLELLVQSHQRLVAEVSHQLRTPLAALRLRLDLLSQDVAPAERADAAGALAEVARLSRLVDGLLAVARAEASTPRPQPLPLGPLLADRESAWAPVAAERGVSLVAPDPGPLLAHASPGHLEQVLDNLIANALDATPAGGRIAVSAEPGDELVVLRVDDSGPGMPAAEREAVLHRLWSTTPHDGHPTGTEPGGPRRLGGTGLGLAIVQRLVQVNGGALTLEDSPYGGLRAIVRLPAARGKHQAAAVVGAARAG